MSCELLKTCGFFAKYKESLDMACRGFITQYCEGPKMEECARKEYRRQHGESPVVDMMPSGQMVPAAYR